MSAFSSAANIAVAITFSLSFLVGVSTVPSDANAEWSRKSAHDCYPASFECWGGECIGVGTGSGVYNPWFDYDAWLVCPLADNSEFTKPTIRSLNVYGQDGSDEDSVVGSVCAAFKAPDADGIGETCSSTIDSGESYVGDFTLSLGSRASALFGEYPHSFGYVMLWMADSGSATRIYGIYQAD